MSLRHLYLLATASFLLPIGNAMPAAGEAIAFNQTPSTPTVISSNSTAKIAATPNLSTSLNAPTTQCPPPPPPFGGPQGSSQPPWIKDINLNTKQQEKINTIDQQSRKTGQELGEQLHQADEKLHSLLTSNAAPEKLRQQHREVQQLRQQLDDHHFETMLAIYQVLTPAQRQQVGKLIQRPPQPIPPDQQPPQTIPN